MIIDQKYTVMYIPCSCFTSLLKDFNLFNLQPSLFLMRDIFFCLELAKTVESFYFLASNFPLA